MKRINIIAPAVLFVALAVLAVVQTQRAQQQAREIAQLREELKQSAEQAKADAEKIAALEQRAQILNAESTALRLKLRAAPPAIASPALSTGVAAADEEVGEEPARSGSKSQMSGFFEKMFKDPEMKKTMAAQQSAVMRQFYTDFVKSAKLTPEQADRFFALLGERQMKMMEKAGDMMNGDRSDDTTANAAQDIADETSALDTQLKALLGDARAKQFQDYEKTLADRIALSQFNQQLSATDAPLSADQTKGLLQVIADERAKQAPPPFQPGTMKGLNMSDAEMQQFFQSQADVNARVRARAMSILNPAQLRALDAFQKQQLEMQKMGLMMARQMFAPTQNEQ